MLDTLADIGDSVNLMLAEYGIPVLSNKPNALTVRYVDAYFPGVAFLAVMGHNDHFPAKPDPESTLEIARKAGLQPS